MGVTFKLKGVIFLISWRSLSGDVIFMAFETEDNFFHIIVTLMIFSNVLKI